MIKKLKYINFQKHKRKVVNLQKGVNCFIGKTDAGKSSLLRGLYWLCFNRPSGDSFVHHDTDSCKMLVVVDKGTSIIRKKAKGKNQYLLNGKTFSAIGSKVPEEITNLLNVTEDNFQMQLDAHFWFSLSPGEVSKQLNKIVNLEEIDRTLSNLSSSIRSAKAEKTVVENRLKEAREELDALSWLPEALCLLQKVQREETHLKRLHEGRERIRGLLEGIRKAERKIREIPISKEQLDTMESRLKDLQKLKEKRDRIQSKWEKIKGEQERCQELQKSVTKIERQIKDLNIKNCPTCGSPIV